MTDAKARNQAAPERTQKATEAVVRTSSDLVRETSERLGGSTRESIHQASAAPTAGAEAEALTSSRVELDMKRT